MKPAIEPVDHVLGSEHAPVSVIEYGDFECPMCHLAVEPVKLLLERYPSKIRFAFRHFPLEEPHPHALGAAEAAEAAGAQGKFWQMHGELFRHQAHLKEVDLLRHAAAIGLDTVRFRADLADHIYLQKVREHVDGARALHIRTTPAFFINGILQDVSFGMNALHSAVDAAVHRHR
jgi:protein-disulfide isomerase